MNKHHQRSEETQSRLLSAGEACFARSGYDGTSVATICQAAGVSKGAFYHHFESKQAIFLELLNRWLAAMDVAMLDMSDSQQDVPAKLMAMTSIVGQLSQVADRDLLIYLEFINRAVRDRQVWQEAIEPYYRYRDIFANLIAEGISEGSLREIDPKSGATIIVGLAVGLLIQGFLDPKGIDWQSVTQEGFSIMLKGLER